MQLKIHNTFIILEYTYRLKGYLQKMKVISMIWRPFVVSCLFFLKGTTCVRLLITLKTDGTTYITWLEVQQLSILNRLRIMKK